MNLTTITVRDASQRTGIPASSIRRLLESGDLAGNRIGNRWRVSEESLTAWVLKRMERHSPPAPSAFAVEDRFA